eukprot:scaffold21040_cov41-Cyclotella_meneghiniana.AAC.3
MGYQARSGSFFFRIEKALDRVAWQAEAGLPLFLQGGHEIDTKLATPSTVGSLRGRVLRSGPLVDDTTVAGVFREDTVDWVADAVDLVAIVAGGEESFLDAGFPATSSRQVPSPTRSSIPTLPLAFGHLYYHAICNNPVVMQITNNVSITMLALRIFALMRHFNLSGQSPDDNSMPDNLLSPLPFPSMMAGLAQTFMGGVSTVRGGLRAMGGEQLVAAEAVTTMMMEDMIMTMTLTTLTFLAKTQRMMTVD